MENESTSTTKGSSKMMPVAIVAVIVVIVIVGAFIFTSKKSEESQESAAGESMEQQAQQPTEQPANSAPVTNAQYKNGKYEAVGNYISPGGDEKIDVTITIADNVVTDAAVVSNSPSGPTARQMQTAFTNGFKEQVIGKNINEINVTKVSSSSLTPKGFMNALEKIKTQAQA